MKMAKRILAVVLSIVLALTVASCGEDTNWIAKKGDTTVPAGIYLYYLTNAYGQAQSMLTEEDANLFKSEIEGKDAEDWIRDEALQLVKEYLVIEDLFAQADLELTEDDTAYTDYYMTYLWSYYSEVYEDNGISYDSMYAAMLNASKSTVVFDNLYGKGGEREVAQDEINAYLTENIARLKAIVFDVTDEEGNALEEGEELTAIETLANEYFERLKSGEDIDALADEYNASLEEETASSEETASVEDTSSEETASVEDTSSDETSSEETSSEEEIDEDRNVAILEKENTSLSEENVETIFALADGEYALIKDTYEYIIVQRFDVLADEETVENYTTTALDSLKGDEYLEYIAQLAGELELEINDKAVKRYNPKKLDL